jgi:1,4-dihydroxy-2-naphthoate octaprenyltransferase
VAVIVAVALGGLPWEALLCLVALPWAWSATRALREREASALNALVRGTAGLHMRFGLLLAAGFVVRALA